MESLENITGSSKLQDFVAIYNDNNQKLLEYINELEKRIAKLESERMTILRANTQLVKIDNKYKNLSSEVKDMREFIADVKNLPTQILNSQPITTNS